MGLISLTYVSVAKKSMNPDEILEILEVSKENNKQLNITGMLLYRDRYFIQVLEGEESSVEGLMDKISNDPRHGNILTVHKQPITERSFGDWSMGFKNLDDIENPQSIEGFSDFLTKPVTDDYFTDNPNRAIKLLESFKKGTWW